MGNSPSCCQFGRRSRDRGGGGGGGAHVNYYHPAGNEHRGSPYALPNGGLSHDMSSPGSRSSGVPGGLLQHMSDREPDEPFEDPSGDPHVETIFLNKFDRAQQAEKIARRRSCLVPPTQAIIGESNLQISKKYNSCSTIFIDDSTVSQPNLKNTIKCVALAIYFHIKNRSPPSGHALEIFDEKRHPLTDELIPDDYATRNPDHRVIYRFLRLLFSSAQLTAEVAIITLIYLERLLFYGEMEICPMTWKRMVLGAILLASKVWDDQAVWNVDYCGILTKLEVQDMNELERQYLEMIQFNINVPSGVYAKYYFDLRTLADKNDFVFPVEPLDKERAAKLEATTRICEHKLKAGPTVKRSSSMEDFEQCGKFWKKKHRLSTIVIS